MDGTKPNELYADEFDGQHSSVHSDDEVRR